MTQEHTMTDVEKLKEAIAVVNWWNRGGSTPMRPGNMMLHQAADVVLKAARSTLPKMKTVEVEQWVVIDKDGDGCHSCLVESEARAYAAERNASDSDYKPYAVVRLAGKGEIPA